ncbi:hypothetical protein UA08_00886 [Talaromyces atroroseus]|uniref:2-dehydropantoate 2-reductase n=1 Tax=Talaromyces atroroseus TaxID=1441469 RepID=A0A225BC03_TALAT|nr:hypothetical protein UA08_00886 [Talaromyces atroroseus]OKL64435.1 hypothetical protein UA08_00886 [Talaromyces atroroseus]
MSADSTIPNFRILVVGAGGVGTLVCVALERSLQASVTAVLRSNFDQVNRHGFEIESIDHGKLSGWRPSAVVNCIPSADPSEPFEYIVVTMKNVPETTDLPSIIGPAVKQGYTTIVLIQNGLYIEETIAQAFPACVILSGVSYVSAHERNGHVVQDSRDRLALGAYHSPSLDNEYENSKLREFSSIYGAAKVKVEIVEDIVLYRWRKLLWNGTFNTMCAITQLDTSAIRRFGEHTMIRPAMTEMAAVAKADGYDLGDDIVDVIIDSIPEGLSIRPSMLVDIDKGNPIEVQVILGNALQIARRRGVQTPILDSTYQFLKLIQARLLAAREYLSASIESSHR